MRDHGSGKLASGAGAEGAKGDEVKKQHWFARARFVYGALSLEDPRRRNIGIASFLRENVNSESQLSPNHPGALIWTLDEHVGEEFDRRDWTAPWSRAAPANHGCRSFKMLV